MTQELFGRLLEVPDAPAVVLSGQEEWKQKEPMEKKTLIGDRCLLCNTIKGKKLSTETHMRTCHQCQKQKKPQC